MRNSVTSPWLVTCGRSTPEPRLIVGARSVITTGIGCFFDDPVRELLGPADLPLQPLYLFTVGPTKPELGLIDAPPYAHRVSDSG